jgi:hypothetical protein
MSQHPDPVLALTEIPDSGVDFIVDVLSARLGAIRSERNCGRTQVTAIVVFARVAFMFFVTRLVSRACCEKFSDEAAAA